MIESTFRAVGHIAQVVAEENRRVAVDREPHDHAPALTNGGRYPLDTLSASMVHGSATGCNVWHRCVLRHRPGMCAAALVGFAARCAIRDAGLALGCGGRWGACGMADMDGEASGRTPAARAAPATLPGLARVAGVSEAT